MMSNLGFPDFFMVGAPKCGTTTIFDWLNQHPDTYLPVKEPNFLSSDILDVSKQPGAISSFEQYAHKLCPQEVTGKLTGDATPKYLYSQTAFDILANRPEPIKILITLRNPVDLTIAMHAQNVRQGRDRQPDFQKAWRRGPESSGDKLTDYAFWGKPGVWVKKYLDTFPAEHCKAIVLEEDLKSRSATTHAEILAFLGLSPQTLESYEALNERRTYRSAKLQGASRRARRMAYGFARRLGYEPGGTGLLAAFDRLNGNHAGRVEVPENVRAEVADALKDDVKILAKTLGRSALPWADFEV